MKGKIWVRTLLQAYNYINRMVRVVDKQVINKGASSHFSYGYGQTLSTMDAIMELTERKRRLNCVKHLIEDSLQFIPAESSKILVLRFLDKQTDKEIGKLLGISARTVQRRINKALGECYLCFIRQDYNAENLQKFLENENWIIEMFNRNVDRKKTKEKKIEMKIPKKIDTKTIHTVANVLWG